MQPQQLELLTVNSLNHNYAYLLSPDDSKVYLVRPEHGKVKFEPIMDDDINDKIKRVISKEMPSSREATPDEMDSILEAFYGEGAEEPDLPDIITGWKTPSYFNDGKFRSHMHAPGAYAFKKHLYNCVAKQVKIESLYRTRNNLTDMQTTANDLLAKSWFSQEKDNFSWHRLSEIILPMNASDKINSINSIPERLGIIYRHAAAVLTIEEEIAKEEPNSQIIIENLEILENYLTTSDRRNVFLDIFISICGIVSTPFALLVGLTWALPAYFLDLPYLGKPEFFLDCMTWFTQSISMLVQNIIFPIAMLQASNTTGSENILKGEDTRLVKTLLARFNDLPQPQENQSHSPAETDRLLTFN